MYLSMIRNISIGNSIAITIDVSNTTTITTDTDIISQKFIANCEIKLSTDDDEIFDYNETCDDPFEEFVSPVRGTPRCCRKCDVGNGMLRLCSNTENTQCRPCKSGFEFSSVRSATKKCMQCRRCEELHPLAKTRTECTPTTDTICQCEKPFYMSEKEQTCKPCTACKPGEGIVK
ncbi:unnamed protein product [Trichobilharzia regenti]|nr:unnamed protein product [Trichobilharzia regenti]